MLFRDGASHMVILNEVCNTGNCLGFFQTFDKGDCTNRERNHELCAEPTAALDPIAEAEVYSNFNSIVGDKTAIYISHRLSSCRFCDRIAVFDGGSVVQFGTHDELLANENGKYYELWTAQAQYYTT